MESIKRSLKGCYWGKVITYFLTCCLFLNTSLPAVMAGPSGGTPDFSDPRNGGASITYNDGIYGNTTTVNVDTTSTIINWDSLDTDGGDIDVRETLAFTQTLTGSAVLNRVSGDATQFNGDLSAPGMSIFIVNPAGVVFGGGSTVNVTKLVASGLNMSNDAFNDYLDDPVNTKMEFAGGNGEVHNRAYIIANSVYLIGKKVFNNGSIQAPNGLVVMAAGDEVRLYENGSDVSVVVSDIGYSLDVRNSNNVSVPNGKIVLAAGDTYSRAILNVSYLAASGGEVLMQAAKVDNSGRIIASSSSGNGGSVNLTGAEEVTIGVDGLGVAGHIEANAGANGDGGSVTIQTDGLFQIDDDSTITATGGSESGDGGSVTITCDDFEIAGEIYASPGNKIEEPGKLEINTSSDVFIADGANAGVMNIIYEEDIEALSQAGTSLIVNAEEGITVQDIDDNEITGQFGNIELHATGDDSAVTFDDITNTIRTTLGDIVIEAGSGGEGGIGINVGNLTTGKDLSDEEPAPGQIVLSTNNGGDIITGDLTIRDGWGHAEINVDSSGDLTVNGVVKVGSESSILNVADPDPEVQRAAEAMIFLNAQENMVLNDNVEAHAYGSEEDTSITTAYIEISAGGDADINGDLLAEAMSSSSGTADAVITVEAVGEIDFPGEAHAIANDAAADSIGPNHLNDEETTPTGYAQIIINASAILLVDDGPGGPYDISKSAVDIVLDVLDNDTLKEGDTIDSTEIDPAAGSVTIDLVGDKTVLTYNPPEDLSTLTFNENGEATVTFTYTVDEKTATVTITLINGLPTAVDDLATTTLGQSVNIDVLNNDNDPDHDPLTPVLGDITPKNGTLVLNEDGTFTYTPNEGFLGDDSFTYTVTDSFNTTSEVEVKITVSISPITTAPLYIPATPALERIEIEISGCPALVKWTAEEIGIDQRLVQIWVANSLASTGNIQPCDACEGLKNAAKILQDADGTHIAALAQVISEFASSTAPPTEEQMLSIADAIARNTDEDSYYAIADEYLDALATYVGILSSEMAFSTIESVQLVTDKYIGRLAQGQNVGVATFIAASLAALGG